MEYKFDVLETQNFVIVKTNNKIFYNIDNTKPFSEIVPKPISSEIFGYLVSDANNIEKSLRSVYFQVEKIKNNNKRYSIDISNVKQCFINFTVRKLPNVNWVNEKDEFILVENIPQNFINDSIVFSIFNNSSYQKSTDEYNNEFFWMSVDQMKKLADENGYDELYNDARTASDRHVYKLLFGEERIYYKLSDDAKAVLDKASELVERSIEMRQVMANDENHLDSWDAGYAQLKLVWKEYFQEDFTEFRRLYKVMEDRMSPLVYELGFLMK
jgi:hypothetical protein